LFINENERDFPFVPGQHITQKSISLMLGMMQCVSTDLTRKYWTRLKHFVPYKRSSLSEKRFITLRPSRQNQSLRTLTSWGYKKSAGKTTLTSSVSVNVLSANFLFCVVPAGGEGGGNRKYVDVSGKC
jgi:hypothetical protein